MKTKKIKKGKFMSKNSKNLQKPMLMVSALVFIVFTVLLIVSCLVPMGKTYSYSDKMSLKQYGVDADVKVTQTLTLKDKNSGETKVNVDAKELKKIFKEKLGDKYSEEDFKKVEESLSKTIPFTYTEKDGKITIAGGSMGVYEIKGNKLVLSDKVSFTSTGSTIVMVVSIILMIVSGISVICFSVASRKQVSKA